MPKVTPAAPSPPRFEGFADTEMKFFKALAKHNDREWFTKHKAEYDEGWNKPMAALLAEVKERLDGAYPYVDLGEPKVFRINRDVRFSADKSPYKTQVSGMLPARTGKSAMEAPAALYLQLGTETFAAAGSYVMDGPTLARWRALLLDEKKGAEVAKMVRALEKKGFRPMAIDALKNAPRGVDPEHPRIELLKLKGLALGSPPVPTASLTSRKIVDWLVTEGKRVAPLVSFLVYETA
jgi:uncharacterized protein (TIGR02453 family)